MRVERIQRRGQWLVGVGLLVLMALVMVVAQGQAADWSAPTGASSGISQPTTPMTTTLPCVFRNYEAARLVVTKTAAPTLWVAGSVETVTYSVTVSNEGDQAGTLLTIADTLPAGFAFAAMAPGSDVNTPPNATTGTITWDGLWVMEPAESLTLIYNVTPTQAPGEYTNQVVVTASAAQVPAEPAQATVTIQPGILLHEDFNDGIDAWTPFLNHHRLSEGQWYYGAQDGTGGSGALSHDCSIGPEVASDGLMMYLQPGAEDWTDYRVEADLWLTGGMSKEGVPQPEQGDPIGFWIRGRYQESENESQWVSGYYVVIVGQSNTSNHIVRISKMQNPDDCDACSKPFRMYNFDNPLEKAWSERIAGPYEHYRWYHLVVEARGNNLKVWLENELVLDWTDPMDKSPYLSGTVGFKTHETMTASFDNIIVTPLD